MNTPIDEPPAVRLLDDSKIKPTGKATRKRKPPRIPADIKQIHPEFETRDGESLSRALRLLDMGLRINTRAERVELLANGDWHPLNRDLRRWLRDELAQLFQASTTGGEQIQFHFSEALWDQAAGWLAFKHQADPFRDWLAGIMAGPGWDRVPRLDCWLGEAFDLAPGVDPDLAAWAGRFLFLGPTMRAFEPGAKLDEMPVLVGPQGCGKSTAAAWVLPPEHRAEWFGDAFTFLGDTGRKLEATSGKVIVEASEMSGSTRAELEGIKAYLSATVDSYRRAYRTDPEPTPRRFVFVGTTNSDSALPNDPSGNWRFVPVEIEGGNAGRVREYLNRWRYQLWAEAQECFLHAEGHPRLPDGLHGRAANAAERNRRSDMVIEDRLDAWLDGATSQTAPRGPFTMGEGMKGCGIDQEKQVDGGLANRIGQALRMRDYKKKRLRLNGCLAYCWIGPEQGEHP